MKHLESLNSQHMQTIAMQGERLLDGQAILDDHEALVAGLKEQLAESKMEVQQLLMYEIYAGKELLGGSKGKANYQSVPELLSPSGDKFYRIE